MQANGKQTATDRIRAPFVLASRLLDLGSRHRKLLEGVAGKGMITILFTDIVNFTGATEAGGERAALALLDAHDDIVVSNVKQNGGRIVKSLGDGSMAAFSDAGSAVTAAAGILGQTRAHDGHEPLRMRLGLDSGRPVKRGDDYIGHTVNVAARLTRSARPGEALASDAVRRSAGRNHPVRFEERANVSLKGLSKPPRIWRLRLKDRARSDGSRA